MRPNEWDRALLSILKKTPYWAIRFKNSKWPYIRLLASNQENKGTLFSQTLKVRENKLVLFSWFEAKWQRYSNFDCLVSDRPIGCILSHIKICSISVICPQIKNIGPIYFSQLWKLDNINWSYFLYEAKWLFIWNSLSKKEIAFTPQEIQIFTFFVNHSIFSTSFMFHLL